MTGRDQEEDGEAVTEEQSGREEIIILEEKKIESDNSQE